MQGNQVDAQQLALWRNGIEPLRPQAGRTPEPAFNIAPAKAHPCEQVEGEQDDHAPVRHGHKQLRFKAPGNVGLRRVSCTLVSALPTDSFV